MRSITTIVLLLFIFSATDAIARRKSKMNCLRGIVVFENPEKRKVPIKATGFVAQYNEKFVPLDQNAFQKEIDRMKQAKRIPLRVKRIIQNYQNAMAMIVEKVKSERGTTNIKPIKEKYARVNTAIEKLSDQLNNLGEFEFAYFSRRVRSAKGKVEITIRAFKEEATDDFEYL
ncbi:MAG: hypothetical protein KAG97_05770, partial [Victivallales bacterium]|nr:hypothetical protein [Victivallales bacterium]